jgi:proliferating cell nuclear antigen
MSSTIRFVFADARIWRYVLRILADYLEVVGMKISPGEGVRIKAMDPSRVMLLDFSIPTTAFEEFVVEKDETLFLNLENVSKILRRAAKTDKFALSSDGTKLTIALISKGGTQRSFTLPLISSTYEEIPELSLEFKVTAKVIGPVFATAISVLEEVGEAIKFKALHEGLAISSSSELGETEFLFTTTSGTLIDYQIADETQEFSNTYSMEYISMLSQISKLAETISVKLVPEAPCEIALDITSGAQLKVYVAPRIE